MTLARTGLAACIVADVNIKQATFGGMKTGPDGKDLDARTTIAETNTMPPKGDWRLSARHASAVSVIQAS